MNSPVLRMPLQTGQSALRALSLGAALFVPGLSGVVFGGLIFLVLPSATPVGAQLWTYLSVAGVLLMLFAYKNLRHALRWRPSDLVISSQGVRLEGGPHELYYKRLVPWPELRQENWRTGKKAVPWLDALHKGISRSEDSRSSAVPSEPGSPVQLQTGPSEEPLVLAEAKEMEEVWSFQAIAEMVRATARHDATRAQPPSKICVLNCGRCGGPARPDDVEAVACPWCNARVEVAADARHRIRAARQLRISERVAPVLIERFLQQPSAPTVNLLGLLVAGVMLLSWPAVIATGVSFFAHGNLSVARILALLLIAPSVIWVTYAGAAAMIVSRHAAQRVTLRMSGGTGARGEAECRLCGAALQQDSLVVACRFCSAPNLLGLDLRAEATDALAQEEELREVLLLSASRRRAALVQLLMATSSTLLVLGWLLLTCVRG